MVFLFGSLLLSATFSGFMPPEGKVIMPLPVFETQPDLFQPAALSYPARPVLESISLVPPSPNYPVAIHPGICQFCGCSGDSCLLSTGDRCEWVDNSRTCCTNPKCKAKLGAIAPKKAEPAKQARKSVHPAAPAKRRRNYSLLRARSARGAWERYFYS